MVTDPVFGVDAHNVFPSGVYVLNKAVFVGDENFILQHIADTAEVIFPALQIIQHIPGLTPQAVKKFRRIENTDDIGAVIENQNIVGAFPGVVKGGTVVENFKGLFGNGAERHRTGAFLKKTAIAILNQIKVKLRIPGHNIVAAKRKQLIVGDLITGLITRKVFMQLFHSKYLLGSICGHGLKK